MDKNIIHHIIPVYVHCGFSNVVEDKFRITLVGTVMSELNVTEITRHRFVERINQVIMLIGKQRGGSRLRRQIM